MSTALATEPTEALYCKALPGMRKVWDYTSLNTLKQCPTLAHYKLHLNRQPSGQRAPLVFGIEFHSCLELYDKLRFEGALHDEAQAKAVSQALHFTPTWEDNNRTRETLVRSVIYYTEQHKDDVLQTYILPQGVPAIELSFRFELPIPSPDGDSYIYCGHIDKIASMEDVLYVVDRKHTTSTLGSNYFDRYLVNAQLMGYMCGARILTGREIRAAVVDAAQIAVSFTRFGRSIFSYTDAQLDEWLHNTCSYILQMEDYVKGDNFPMNDSACGNFGGCAFTQVCSSPPSIREAILNSNYEERLWDPTVVR